MRDLDTQRDLVRVAYSLDHNQRRARLDTKSARNVWRSRQFLNAQEPRAGFHPKRRHLVAERGQPARACGNDRGTHEGASSALAYNQTFIYKTADRLAECGPAYTIKGT